MTFRTSSHTWCRCGRCKYHGTQSLPPQVSGEVSELVFSRGAMGWGEWSPRSAQLQPQVLLPENPLREDEGGRRGGGGRSGRSSRGR